MLTIQLPTTFTDSTLPNIFSDPLIQGSNNGVRFLFDASISGSWPKQQAPLNNDIINDLSAHGNGKIAIAAGSAIGFAGGGFDFTGGTTYNNYIEGAIADLATIMGATNQYFLFCAYMKLPASADWNTTGTIKTMFQASATGTNYTSAPELLVLAQNSASSMSVRRQTALNTVETTQLTLPSSAFGTICQIGFYRNASGQYLRVKNATATTIANIAVGANNTADFSALTPKWGLTQGFGASFGSSSNGLKLYRGFIEDLTLSGRSPLAILEADYSRVMNRYS